MAWHCTLALGHVFFSTTDLQTHNDNVQQCEEVCLLHSQFQQDCDTELSVTARSYELHGLRCGYHSQEKPDEGFLLYCVVR